MPPPPAVKKATSPVLWYAWDYAIPLNFNPAQILAAGCTGGILVSNLKFDPQNRALSLDELRKDAQAIKEVAGPLPVWWGFSCVRQAGNPTPGAPTRTFCDPRDQAARVQLLNNYASIGRVAKEFGFVGVALDTEDFGGAGLPWPDEPGAKQLGADLATACRQNNSTLGLCAFGPLGGFTPGFQHVWRGFFGAAGKGATFYTIDTYGIARVNVKQALKQVGNITQCATPGLGWWPEGTVSDPAAVIAAAAPNVKVARTLGAPLFIYHQGATLLGQRGELAQVLAS